jgi:hypothetical protein
MREQRGDTMGTIRISVFRREPTRPLSEVLAELKLDGKI